jgi:carnitine-CoA ligase
MDAVIGNLLEERAQSDPDSPFLWCDGTWRTFAEVHERSDRVAAGLSELGVAFGDRVALLTPNRMEMLELYFACAKLGAIQVPLNAFLKGEFLRYQLADARATTLVADAAGWRAVQPLLEQLPELGLIVQLDDDAEPPARPGVRAVGYVELDAATGTPPDAPVTPDHLMSIVYTSGTTGLPKGCMLPHGYYVRVARKGVDFLGVSPQDVHLTAMPMFHASARLLIVGSALCTGSSVAVMGEFSPRRVLELASQLDATIFGGVGAMGAALLNLEPSDLDQAHALRLAWFVPFTVEQQDRFKARFGVPDVTSELYGQTECFPLVFNPLSGPRNLASDGKAAPDLDVRLVDDDGGDVRSGVPGEIIARATGPHAMFQGYWNKPEANESAFRDGWYHTGDFGRSDDDGFVSFVDRKKDALRRRGENVSSMELETAIGAHPKVAEVAVHAVPSALTEDDIKACIVLRAGEELTPDEAFEFFKQHLPYYAVPRYVEVLPELPRNAVSRVMKHQLRDRGITAQTWDLDALGLTVAKADRR